MLHHVLFQTYKGDIRGTAAQTSDGKYEQRPTSSGKLFSWTSFQSALTHNLNIPGAYFASKLSLFTKHTLLDDYHKSAEVII